MGKRRGGKRGPERVKETKSQATPLEELIQQIREINPTGRGLSPQASEQRYRRKSALQGELIQRFGDELDVIGEPGDAVVSLRTRTLGRDACHAVVEELSEEARAWIRRKLDEVPEEDEAVPAVAPTGEHAGDELGDWEEATVDELLAGGRAAVDQYDFDLGQRLLRRAFEASRGAPAACRAYLALLVDQLGMDDEAGELATRLTPEARADGEVRVLLAVSAARAGDREGALRWLASLQHPRVSEVLAQLAQAEIKAGRVSDALRMARRLEEADPAHPVVRDVAAWAEERRAQQRAPAEREILKLAESGDFASAARAARALLESDPGSATARRVLAEAEAQLRERVASGWLASARKAAARGELLEGIALLRRVVGQKVAEATTREAEQLLETLEATLAKEKSEAAVQRVCELLRREDPSAGLLAYLALADSEREALRAGHAEVALPWLPWLEEVAAATKQRAAAVQAVMCLRAVSGAQESDPEAFLRAVSGHDLLRRVADCRKWTARAQELLREQRERAALDALTRARACFSQGDLGEAAGILENVPLQDLPPSDQAVLRALRAEVDQGRRRRRLCEAYDANVREEKWLEARDVALEAAEGEPDPWAERAEAMQARVQEAWRMRVDRTPSTEPMPELDFLSVVEGSFPLLSPDGERVVLHRAEGCWSFVTVARLSDGAILERAMFQTPSAMDYGDAFVLGEELWVVADAKFFMVSIGDWRVKRWVDVGSRFFKECTAEISVAPDRVHVWVDVLRGGYSASHVVNLETGVVVPIRDFSPPLFPLWGSSTPSVVTERMEGPPVFADCRGRPLSAIGAIATCVGATVMPSGRGFVAVGGFEETEGLFVVASEGGDPFLLPLPGFEVETGACTMGVSSEQGLVFFCARNVQGGWELCAFRIGQLGIEQAYRKPVPAGWSVVMAADATRAVLVSTSGGVVRAVALGAEEPTVPEGREPDRVVIPTSGDYFTCPTSELDPGAKELSEILGRHDPRGAVEAYEREHEEDPDALWRLHEAASRMAALPLNFSLQKRIVERYPGHPISRCVLAEDALRSDPGQAVELLEGLNPDLLPPGYRCHREHLLGMAYLELGDVGKAREALEKVRQHPEPRCEVEGWLSMMQEVALPLPSDWWEQERSGVEKLVGGIAQADVHLGRGEVLEAWRVLDRPLVWSAKEQQSVARLAEAGMRCCEAGKLDRFVVAPVVAMVCGKERWRSLVVAGAWDEGKMRELVERGARWLAG